VGFRPTVHRVATGLGLGGFVQNTPDGVVVEVEGVAAEGFLPVLRASLPPLARLDDVRVEGVQAVGAVSFEILASTEGVRERAIVPPDTALCADCRAEMEDLDDRRFHYPFTTCTNCGPRFSLVRALPYDRERTSMACFALCPECRREYTDPTSRRFHAEPVCCPACGPRLWVTVPSPVASDPWPVSRGESPPGASADALREAREALGRGEIVAIKGLGGFQLACRADDGEAVARLRARKRRPSKPFAVMVRDMETAGRLVVLGAADEAEMTSVGSPIVLAPRRTGGPPVVEAVAPGLGDLGVLLPTTPLHVELFRGASFEALIMTSGNASDEPICRGNREAVERLGDIADRFLLHDRDVVRRIDDSVVRSAPDGPFVVRRARGLVPEALPLPARSPRPVLALGGFLQNAACLVSGPEAFCSQHVGDLDSEPARAFLEEVVEGLEDFLQARGEVIVVDAHPDYPSTWLGQKLTHARGGELLRVQHHLAHAAGVLAEHARFPAPGRHAVAVALDGTGWGPDSTAWGGEWLRLDGDLVWRRLASLQPLPLVGGEAAVREPWRVLVAALALEGAEELLPGLLFARDLDHDRLERVAGLTRGRWPLASGAGRVFEALGALLGVALVNGYEGEAAARAEALAATSWPAPPWPEVKLEAGGRSGIPQLPTAALLRAAAERVLAGAPSAVVAAGFHSSFVSLAAAMTSAVEEGDGQVVALGGGCLVNRLLREGLAHSLREAGFEPLLPRRVPPGDGGLAYGQAVLGVVATLGGVAPVQEGVD